MRQKYETIIQNNENMKNVNITIGQAMFNREEISKSK